MKLLVQCLSHINPQAIAQLSALVNTTATSGRRDRHMAFFLAAAPSNEMRASVREICRQHQCDHAWIANSRSLESYGFLVFDMDSTLINIECIDELAERAGCGAEVAAITARAMRGEDMDYDRSIIARVQLLKGLAEDELRQVYDQRLQITPGAHLLVQQARRAGLKTAIISGGFEYFANRLKDDLNIDVAVSNRLVMENGHLTGALANQPVNAEVKASTVKSLCASWGIELQDVIVVGDGANDLRMMEIAGLSVGHHPKEIVATQVDVLIDHLPLDSLLGYLRSN